MALRAAGCLQEVERAALGSRQPLYSLGPLDGLSHLTTLRLGPDARPEDA